MITKTYKSRIREEVSRCVDRGKQLSVRQHVVIGVAVVKEPSGSPTEHIESSKSTAGGSGDCKTSQQELPLRLKPS